MAWPTPGYVRGPVITTSGTNGALWLRANVNIDCAGVINAALGPTPGGALVKPGATAGSFIDTSVADYWHVQQGSQQGASWAKVGFAAGTAATVTAIASEFVDDAGAYATVLLGNDNGHGPVASSTTYESVVSSIFATWSATQLVAAIPIPFAATLGPFDICTSSGPPANSETITVNKNGSATALTVTIGTSDPSIACYADLTDAPTVAAGDYINLAGTAGASTVAVFGAWNLRVIPASGTSTMIAGLLDATVTTTAKYAMPGTNSVSTTQANQELGLPIACTASNLYVVQAVANGAGVTTTFTLNKNGSATAITGTITSGSGTGSIAVDTTHSVSFAVGDLMQLQFITGSGTSGTMGGWAIKCL